MGKPETPAEEYLSVFFTGTEASRAAGQAVLGRIYGARTVDRDAATDWQTRLAQYDAVCAWGQPNHSLLERVSAIDKPVFVANGDSDPMILPRYSYLLAGLIPQGAHQDLPGRGARLPLPAPRRVRRRRRRLPGQMTEVRLCRLHGDGRRPGDDPLLDAIAEAMIERALRSGPDCVTREATAGDGLSTTTGAGAR